MAGVSPVVLFVFNRPDHTKLTVESLLRNDLSGQTSLIVYSDAAARESDEALVASVRDYIRGISGFKDVQLIEQSSNQGLANSVIAGVTEVVERYGTLIVLEDDMETSRYFLAYMNEALSKYQHEERVYCIHGYAFPADMQHVKNEAFFLKGAECWGWATWKPAWERFCPDADLLLGDLKKQGLESEFNYNGSFPYLRMLKRQSLGRIDSWAIRWRASAFINNGLTLWPRTSLVRNIGLDGSGVHCDSTDYFDVQLAQQPVRLENIPIEVDQDAYKSYAAFLKRRQGGILVNLYRFFRKRICNVLFNK